MNRNEWPWVRPRTPASERSRLEYIPSNYKFRLHNFASTCLENQFPDIDTKITAIKASPFVVSLVSYSGYKEISQGTGTIIEENGTILTSAKLITCPTTKNVVAKNLKVIVHLWDGKYYEAEMLAHDFYYDLAIIKIQKNVTHLKPACLRFVDDCASFDPCDILIIHDDDEGFQSHAYNLIPGVKLIALGRNFIEPYEIMAAPGEFRKKRVNASFECKELFMASCLITETGHGGPLVNFHGEVVGVASFDLKSTPFIPINVVLKWWNHFKNFRKVSRPLLGIELASNLYTPKLHIIENFIRKFNNQAGVYVEEVKQGSSADTAGICTNDIIVECCGKPVGSFLQLFDIMWDKMGDSVNLVVIRASDWTRLDLTMKVIEATQVDDEFCCNSDDELSTDSLSDLNFLK